jgi:hypothetical protein
MWFPLYRGLGGPQGRSGWVRKISSAPGFDPLTVLLVASRCMGYTIPRPTICCVVISVVVVVVVVVIIIVIIITDCLFRAFKFTFCVRCGDVEVSLRVVTYRSGSL